MVMWTSVVKDSDAAIIWQSRLEPECFAAIFDRYYIQIHGYAARRLGHSLADDVAAETFLIAFERWDRYDVSWLNARPHGPVDQYPAPDHPDSQLASPPRAKG
jgi:hypothetical protein